MTTKDLRLVYAGIAEEADTMSGAVTDRIGHLVAAAHYDHAAALAELLRTQDLEHPWHLDVHRHHHSARWHRIHANDETPSQRLITETSMRG